jgi:hypothetical protein
MFDYSEAASSVAWSLKLDLMKSWIEAEWVPRFPQKTLLTFRTTSTVVRDDVVERFSPEFALPGGYFFVHYKMEPCAVIPQINDYNNDGAITHRTGAFVYEFANPESGETVQALAISAHYKDDGWSPITLVCLEQDMLPLWAAFAKECNRLGNSFQSTKEVMVIGGRSDSFQPINTWDDVILPAELKLEIQEDVQSFFAKGVDVYKRLSLKPFRKLLLAGVPGTGKTMICSALSKWALDQGHLVIYVSSAEKSQRDRYGSGFTNIQDALGIAANSSHPTLILLEEIDAYLREGEKALVLNVLDGSESEINERGTLLVATTNYPEKIDERVLKRPGRLDRIFIIPETRGLDDAEQMLRRYLGGMWRDEHSAIVPELVGYPGAFIREVAIYALTQVAYDDLDVLPLETLEKSFKGLKSQIDAREDFLSRRREFGFSRLGNGNHGW